MKKLNINIPDENYYDCITGKLKGKDLFNCSYEELYNFSKQMLKAVSEGNLERPSIEVGNIVIKVGAVFDEIYGIVTHKQNGICVVMFEDGHTALVLEDGLRSTGTNRKDLLNRIFECIKESKNG